VADAAHCLLASPLPRARQTLERVANGRKMEIDPVFVEAPLPSMPIPFLRFSPDTWGVISRVGWWLGIAGAGESRREAEERAARAADMLIRRAADHGNVLLCAHGWFNRMTGRALRERGWRCIHDGGDRHWSWRTYVPPRHHL
jgi:broad specificity phosphatase PhoE